MCIRDRIENGVGLVRRFRDESSSLFRRKRWTGGATGGTVATGRSASRLVAGFLQEFSTRARARFVAAPVVNHLMGDSVTVTGPVSYTHLTLPTNREV